MLRALLSQLVCPDALLGTPRADGLVSLSKIAQIGCLGAAWRRRDPPRGQPLIAGIGRGVVRVVRARLAGHRSGRGEIYFPQGTPPTTPSSRSRHKYGTKERYIQQVRVDDRRGEGSYRRVDRGRRRGETAKRKGRYRRLQ